MDHLHLVAPEAEQGGEALGGVHVVLDHEHAQAAPACAETRVVRRCRGGRDLGGLWHPHGQAHYELASLAGVTFANTITTNDSLNVQTDVYVYNGAGVAVGDIDNDGLPDIFFSGNMVSSRLYLNKGQMRFDDITEQRRRHDEAMGHRRDDGGHQQRRLPGHLRLRVRTRMVEAGRPGESAVHQQRESHVHRGGRDNTASPTPASPRTPCSWITTATDASISFCSTIRPRISRAA